MIAIIPARGGSKGVPKKNIRLLCGKPLIQYTIEAALESGIFEKVIVSTDSMEIKEIAENCGAWVPFLRPEEISGDMVSSDDVIMHALYFLENKGQVCDEVCKLQPTSPLRNAGHIAKAYEMFKEKNADFVVSVCECEHSPLWSGVLGSDGNMNEFLDERVKRACRQELPAYYRLNGAIYMAKTEAFKKEKNFFGKNSYAYVMSQMDSIDIDSELDFMMAEFIYKKEES